MTADTAQHQPPFSPAARLARAVVRTRLCRRGFSMVEIVIVMIIIGVISAVALPRFANSLSTQRADAAARVIAADIERAVNLARSQSAPVTIILDTATNTYQIVGLTLTDSRGGRDRRVIADEFPGVSLAACDFNGLSTVTVDGYGTPISAGVVVLRHGDDLRTLVLSKSTGRVRLYRGVPDADNQNAGQIDDGAENNGAADAELASLLESVADTLSQAVNAVTKGGSKAK